MNHKVLHVCNQDKSIPPFIDFVEEHFGLEDHFFWLIGDYDRYPVRQNKSNYKVNKSIVGQFKGLLKLVHLFHTSEKVVLHGLFNPRIILLLFLMPWVLRKCYWVIWGGDLYVHQLGEKNWKWIVREFFRRPVIKNMGHLVTYISGDVELTRQWYGTRGEYHECLMYLSNVVDPSTVQAAQKQTEEHSSLYILVGNSADPSNNHIESFEKLLPYKDEDIKIFVPLSYGDQSHAKQVIEIGKSWFGDKFVPITSFMVFDEYMKFLASVDVAIFNHKRQQAMGSTITLLGMGKTVYIRSDVAQWDIFKEKNITCFDVESFEGVKLSYEQSGINSISTLDYFNITTLLNQYSKLFML